MFGLMRVSTHKRLLFEAEARVAERCIEVGFSLGKAIAMVTQVEDRGQDPDFPMRQIQVICESKGVILDDDQWHENDGRKGSEYD